MAALVLAEPGTPRLLSCFDDSGGAAFSWARGSTCTGVPGSERGGGGALPQPRTGPCPYPGVAAFIESVCTQARMPLPACVFTEIVCDSCMPVECALLYAGLHAVEVLSWVPWPAHLRYTR